MYHNDNSKVLPKCHYQKHIPPFDTNTSLFSSNGPQFLKEDLSYALNYHAHLRLWFSNALRCKNHNFGDFERVWVPLITPIGPAWHTVGETPGRHTQFKFPVNSQIGTFVIKTAVTSCQACNFFFININICSVENFKRGPVLIIYQSSLSKRHQLLPTLSKLLTQGSS